MQKSAVAGGSRVTRRWGWGLSLFVGALLILNGVSWWFMGGSLSTFEQDTGVPLAEFRTAYPTVADAIASEARHVAIWFIGFGLLALLVAVEGFRHGSGWAWTASWVVAGTLVALALAVLMSGEVAFGAFLVGMLVVALAGQVLARP